MTKEITATTSEKVFTNYLAGTEVFTLTLAEKQEVVETVIIKYIGLQNLIDGGNRDTQFYSNQAEVSESNVVSTPNGWYSYSEVEAFFVETQEEPVRVANGMWSDMGITDPFQEKIINMTGHELNFISVTDKEGDFHDGGMWYNIDQSIPSEGSVKVVYKTKDRGTKGGIKAVEQEVETIVGLPPVRKGVIIVVSAQAAQAARAAGRSDVWAVGRTLKDSKTRRTTLGAFNIQF